MRAKDDNSGKMGGIEAGAGFDVRVVPPYAQLQRWSAASRPDLPALNVAILRNIVLDPIVPYLRYFAFREGLDARCSFGEYDNVVQEAVGGAPELLNGDTDCVLLFLRLDTLSPRLAREFPALSAVEVAEEVERVQALIDDVIAGIRRQTPAMILWHSFELPLHPSLGTLDGQRNDEGQSATIERLNAHLREALPRARNAYIVDLNRCLARLGADTFYDTRYWHVARAPYTLRAVQEIAAEGTKYIRALKGKARKCLVLDCDGVLWGGTIGEDGLAGIKLGTTFPGSCYREFQQEALNLYHRGVVLALCSKNNPADVWEVFDRHPDMVLRREHIAAARINWADKAANLTEIANELGLGRDSLVMVDDSDFEVGLIRNFLPDVTVLHLPPGSASENGNILAGCGLFDTLTLSAEDRARGAAYQAEAARRKLRLESQDMHGFLDSLDMALDISISDDFAIPRIAQLTQKTNQFNLTTRRYSEEDIRRFDESPDADVIYLRYRDRFGDAGIVGICIIRYDEERAVLDSFLLSCRILGRSVEKAFLAACLKRASLRGARTALGEYRATAKNAQVRDFYTGSGFTALAPDTDAQRYSIELDPAGFVLPDLFRINAETLWTTAQPDPSIVGTQGGPTP